MGKRKIIDKENLTIEKADELYRNKAAFIRWAVPYICACFLLDIVCVLARINIAGGMSVRDVFVMLAMNFAVIFWARIIYKSRIAGALNKKFRAERKRVREYDEDTVR